MWGRSVTNHSNGEVIPRPTSGPHQITDMPAAPHNAQRNITFSLSQLTVRARVLWKESHNETSTNMPAPDKKPRTLYDKVFQDHIVDEKSDGTVLLYIGKCGSGGYCTAY